MLIALDASTVRTGFTFGSEQDSEPKGGVWSLPGADEMVFDRTLGLAYDSLHGLARLVKATHVAIEAPITVEGRSAHTAMALIQLTGALRAAAHRASCKLTLVASGTVRKTFIGRGDYPGPEAKLRVQEMCRALGWPFKDDNQADANAVWAHIMKIEYPAWWEAILPRFAAAAEKAGWDKAKWSATFLPLFERARA